MLTQYRITNTEIHLFLLYLKTTLSNFSADPFLSTIDTGVFHESSSTQEENKVV